MSDHPNPERLRSFTYGHLTPAEILSLDDHLASCESCRAIAAAMAPLRGDQISFSLTSPQADFHIPYDRIPATSLTAEETSHLEECPECRSLRGELAALQHQIDRREDIPKWFGRTRHTSRAMLALAASLVVVVATLVTVSINQQDSAPSQIRRGPGVPGVASAPPRGEELRDGNRVIAVDRSGNVAGLQTATPPVAEAIRQLMSGSLPRNVTAELQGRRAVLLGTDVEEKSVKLISPVGTVVREQRPVFRWAIAAMNEVQIDLYDRNFERVMTSGPVKGSDWTCSTSLKRGEMYRWQIRYRDGENEIVVPSTTSADARFMILSKSALADLTREERVHADSHLVLGALYANAGLLDDAERELTAFAAANPASMLPRRLLDSLNKLRQ